MTSTLLSKTATSCAAARMRRLASLFLLLLLLLLLFESFHLLVKVKLYNSKSVTRLTRAAIQRHLTLTYLVGVVAIHS